MLPAIRVLLADDHPAIRAGVRSLLDADDRMDVVGEANTGPEALRRARQGGIDVLLLDMELPGMSGVDVAKAVKDEGLEVRVLAYSSYDDASFVRGVLEGGASGYITKDLSGDQVVEAIAAVARGEERWFVSPDKKVDPIEAAGLTQREAAVLKLLARGLTNAEIAELLHVSERRVKNVLTTVYGKLDVAHARDAVAWAWERGVVRDRNAPSTGGPPR